MITSIELSKIASYYLPEPHASLFNGLLLGISIKNTGDFYSQTIDSGLIHLVVVSGSNVALLKIGIENVFGFLSRKVLTLFTLCTLVFFLVLIGLNPPIVRAVFSASIFLLGSLMGKSTSSMYVLLLTAIISLILFPEWVSSLSFYLTYLSTSGIMLFAKPITEVKGRKSITTRLLDYLKAEIKTSIAAQAFITPLIFFYFGRVPFISIITSPLISWTILPIMFLGTLLLVCDFILQDLAKLLCVPLYWLLNIIIQVIYIFS